MQIVNCSVAIDGEAAMTVFKERVTVPEILILRAVHGDDAVRNIEVIADEKIETAEERARLTAIYRNPENVVRDTFGAAGALPKTLDDAGIDDEFVISSVVPKAKKAAPKTDAQEMNIAAEADPAPVAK